MSGPALADTFVLRVSPHNLSADLTAERRARLATVWREIAVGHLARARAMRREGDTAGAEALEAAADDWCVAAELLEWGEPA